MRRLGRWLLGREPVAPGSDPEIRVQMPKGDHWDLGPGFYECFFTDAGPDDVVSSFQAISLT